MIAISDVTDVLSGNLDSVLSWDKIREIVFELHQIDDEWEPMEVPTEKLGYTMSTLCPDICLLAQQTAKGHEFRFLRRAAAATATPTRSTSR